MSQIHAKPLAEVNEVVRAGTLERGDAVVVPEAQVDASPGIHHLTKGTTYLSEHLKVKDSDQTKLLNNFVLERMKQEGLQDSPQAYKQTLRGFLKGLGVSETHDLGSIMHKVMASYENGSLLARDYLILFSLLNPQDG